MVRMVICLAYKISRTQEELVSLKQRLTKYWSSAASLEILKSNHVNLYEMVLPKLEWPPVQVEAFPFRLQIQLRKWAYF